MDIFLLYIFTRVDALQIFCGVAGFFIFAFVLMKSIHIDCEWNIPKEEKAVLFKKARKPLWGAAVLLFVMVIIPDQKSLAIILAGHGVLEVAKSETAGRLASKSVQLIEQTLDGYLKKEAK